MINWFAPKCPVDEETRLWLEDSFRWLVDELGAEVLLEAPIVLPTEEFFPDVFRGREEDVPPLLARVCEYMDVEFEQLELRFYSEKPFDFSFKLLEIEKENGGTAGYFQTGETKYLIGIETAQLTNPTALVGTLAHELGHVILLGEDRVSATEEDHEPLTDLLTIYYGLGVFTANSVFSFSQFTNTFGQGWQAQSRGYLTEEMFGYALALFAWLRAEKNPAWARFLNVNVKSYFKNSLKYIESNSDEISPDLKRAVKK